MVYDKVKKRNGAGGRERDDAGLVFLEYEVKLRDNGL